MLHRRAGFWRAVAATLGLAAAWWAGAREGRAFAQVNLPPPPPPPLATDKPPPPPPPDATNRGSPSREGQGSRDAREGREKPAHTRPRPAEHASPPPEPAQHSEPSAEPRADTGPHRFTLRLNPLPLVYYRLSADFEVQLAPHHAVVLAPHLALRRNRTQELVNAAFGYTGAATTSFGAEVGYHYWLAPRMDGLFLGPSLLFGVTSPQRGDAWTYVGLAGDIGYQHVFASGFTLLGGGGVLIVTPGGGYVIPGGGSATRVTPRLLAGIGWSF